MEAIRKVLEAEGVKEAHFLIDAPISNSGRLSSKIEDMLTVYLYLAGCNFDRPKGFTCNRIPFESVR